MTQGKIPERIGRLDELAGSLWWSWHAAGRLVFRTLDYTLWRQSEHNPVQQLDEINREKLEAAASDPAFLALYDAAITAYDKERKDGGSWYSTTNPGTFPGPIAYFSMEFAIHHSLPIYAGGLGVLAGDICKEASDLGLPMVAVGFMYPQGYFRQRISADGWQEEEYRQLDFSKTPVRRILSPEGRNCLAEVQLEDNTLHVGAWLVNLGRVNLYLLDTGLEENEPQERQLSNRLYTGDRKHRLEQEILLGVGGVRVLRTLGIQPSIWHANEGHTAFMMLERIREEVAQGKTFDKALESVQKASIFTTHTPVPEGHDIFTNDLVSQHFEHYWPSLGIDRNAFLDLGRINLNGDDHFNMTVLALKTSSHRNAVSKLHGQVTRRMWHGLWPDLPEDEVPIIHVTNGIHIPTWIAFENRQLYEKYLGQDWFDRRDDVQLWDRIRDIPAGELWRTHLILKRKLFHIILEQAQIRWARGQASPQQILAMGSLLDSDTLTVAFARRFTEYKRPSLLFHDIDRLIKIVNNPERPVQIIFAGKSHPTDGASKTLLQRVYTMARDRVLQGRIAFLEDYDIHLARYLVQGADVWLNTPRRLQEASGTSGMKAALNGVLNLSVPDGWWHEGFNGENGWVVGDDTVKSSLEAEDQSDAESLYDLLESRVAPLYYDRDRSGVPQAWMAMVKKSISSIAPAFSARRMLKEYFEEMYLPAIKPTAIPVRERETGHGT
jgi:starch phosphorylase